MRILERSHLRTNPFKSLCGSAHSFHENPTRLLDEQNVEWLKGTHFPNENVLANVNAADCKWEGRCYLLRRRGLEWSIGPCE
jgi:hypothetical protein